MDQLLNNDRAAVEARAGVAAGSKEMAGPTEYSNWVVPKRILCGSVPRPLDLPKFINAGACARLATLRALQTETALEPTQASIRS